MAYFTDAPSYLSNPSFGVDTAGTFSSAGSSLASNPFASSSAGSSSMAFPFAAVASLGSAALGLFGAQKSANATEAAAAQAAEATEKAAKFRSRTELAKDIGGFGFDYFTQRYNTGAGAAANRWNQMQDVAQMATFQAQNPDQINLRAAERAGRAQDYAARLAAEMPGYQPPIGLFG